jgi:hypothetical protein
MMRITLLAAGFIIGALALWGRLHQQQYPCAPVSVRCATHATHALTHA